MVLKEKLKIKEKEEKKFICDKCNQNFNNLKSIKNHLHNDCRPSIKSNNIYTFPKTTLCPSVELDFSHPVKEIAWVIQRTDIGLRSSPTDQDFTYGNDWFNYSCFKSRNKNIVKDPFETSNLMFNGQERNIHLYL